MSDVLADVLAYAESGLAVYPVHNLRADGSCSCGKDCDSPGKHPRWDAVMIPNGKNAASADPAMIRAWWQKWPDAQVGMACGPSGVVALDVDVRPDRDGHEAWRALVVESPALEAAPVASTPGGGFHAYFRANGERVGLPHGDPLGPGIDVIGEGGAVILPSAASHARSWVDASGLGASPLPPLPPAVAERLSLTRAGRHRAARETEASKVREGGRNAHLASVAGTMRQKGFLQPVILAALLAENTERCEPPLHEREVASIAASVAKYLPADPPDAPPLLTCLSDVEPLTVEWLWPRRIPLGMLTILFGDAGLGKSHVWQDIVTRMSINAVWPDGGRAPLGDSVILSAEDDAARVIVPRLRYAGADLSRAHVLSSVADFDGKGRRTFSLMQDVARLEEAVRSVSARLAVVDPLTAYLDGIDSHVTTDVRSALVKLSDVGERTGAAVFCIMHPNKDGGRGTKALYRLAGSGAFGAAPRSVMLVSEDEARKDEGRRLLLPVKLNVAAMPEGLGFRVVASSPHTCESGIGWDFDPVQVDADAALGCGRTDSSVIEQATDFLRTALADGEWHPAQDLYAAAAEQGIHEKALSRARKRMGATYRKDGFGGGFRWRLNSEDS